MADTLSPDAYALLAAKPETAIAVLGAELRGAMVAILQRIDSVLQRQDASDQRHREFEHNVRQWVDHEAANRRLADDKLQADIQAVDRKKVVEQPHMDALNKRYEDGMGLLKRTVEAGEAQAKRIDTLDDALDRRRLIEKFIWSALGVAGAGAGWAIKVLVDAGYIHA